MTTEQIKQIEEYFTEHWSGDYKDAFGNTGQCKKYFHKEENFYLIIFDDGEVYQANTDHEIFGIELKTIQDLQIRFKSLTGGELEYIPNESWKKN